MSWASFRLLLPFPSAQFIKMDGLMWPRLSGTREPKATGPIRFIFGKLMIVASGKLMLGFVHRSVDLSEHGP